MDVQELIKSYNAATQTPTLYGGLTLTGALTGAQVAGASVAPVYGAAIAIDATLGNLFLIVITNGVAFAIGAASGGITGQVIRLRFKNTSGGVAGAGTFNANYKMVSNTLLAIATGFSRTVTFAFDGTNWVEVNYAADVPN